MNLYDKLKSKHKTKLDNSKKYSGLLNYILSTNEYATSLEIYYVWQLCNCMYGESTTIDLEKYYDLFIE